MTEHSDEQAQEEEQGFSRRTVADVNLRLEKLRSDPVAAHEHADEKLSKLLVDIDGIMNWQDWLDALEILTKRVENVQRMEGMPRHGENNTNPSVYRKAQTVLFALHHCLVGDEAGELAPIYEAARAYVGRGNKGDGRDAISRRLGLDVQKKGHFGDQLKDLMRELLVEMPEQPPEEVITRVARSHIWALCPFPQLRGLSMGPKFGSRLQKWHDASWERRSGEDAQLAGQLARALLRRLGIRPKDADNTVPKTDP